MERASTGYTPCLNPGNLPMAIGQQSSSARHWRQSKRMALPKRSRAGLSRVDHHRLLLVGDEAIVAVSGGGLITAVEVAALHLEGLATMAGAARILIRIDIRHHIQSPERPLLTLSTRSRHRISTASLRAGPISISTTLSFRMISKNERPRLRRDSSLVRPSRTSCRTSWIATRSYMKPGCKIACAAEPRSITQSAPSMGAKRAHRPSDPPADTQGEERMIQIQIMHVTPTPVALPAHQPVPSVTFSASPRYLHL